MKIFRSKYFKHNFLISFISSLSLVIINDFILFYFGAVSSSVNSYFSICIFSLVASSFFALIYSIFIVIINSERLRRIHKKISLLVDNNFNELSRLPRRSFFNDELDKIELMISDIATNLQHSYNIIDARNAEINSVLEKEKMLEAERRDFTASASHELKTPLSIIKGYLEGMLYDVGKFKDHKLYLQKTIDVCNEMTSLIMEMIEINKLDSSRKPQISKLSLTEIMNSRVQRFKSLFDEKKQKVSTNIPDNIDIYADKHLLELALNNIISNANKYSPDGAKIYIAIIHNEENIIIKVRNYGVTIPEIKKNNLFNQFITTDASRNKADGGSGMGLYIVKRICDLLEFEYEIYNIEDATEFLLKINLKKQEKYNTN